MHVATDRGKESMTVGGLRKTLTSPLSLYLAVQDPVLRAPTFELSSSKESVQASDAGTER